ncbi:hypothetical protein K4F52_005884 [Lecanicillium sp. MT-2017a]|nr:hypothetical protein K4F52_005884 [Lecanicillium sp. MT-2017a]
MCRGIQFRYTCSCIVSTVTHCPLYFDQTSNQIHPHEPSRATINLTGPCAEHAAAPGASARSSITEHLGLSRESAARKRISMHTRRIKECGWLIGVIDTAMNLLAAVKERVRGSQLKSQMACDEAYQFLNSPQKQIGPSVPPKLPLDADDDDEEDWFSTEETLAEVALVGVSTAIETVPSTSAGHRQNDNFIEQQRQSIAQVQDYFDPINAPQAIGEPSSPQGPQSYPNTGQFSIPRRPVNLNKPLPPLPVESNERTIQTQTIASSRQREEIEQAEAIRDANQNGVQFSQPTDLSRPLPATQWRAWEALAGGGPMAAHIELAGRAARAQRRRYRPGARIVRRAPA